MGHPKNKASIPPVSTTQTPEEDVAKAKLPPSVDSLMSAEASTLISASSSTKNPFRSICSHPPEWPTTYTTPATSFLLEQAQSALPMLEMKSPGVEAGDLSSPEADSPPQAEPPLSRISMPQPVAKNLHHTPPNPNAPPVDEDLAKPSSATILAPAKYTSGHPMHRKTVVNKTVHNSLTSPAEGVPSEAKGREAEQKKEKPAHQKKMHEKISQPILDYLPSTTKRVISAAVSSRVDNASKPQSRVHTYSDFPLHI